MNLTEAKFSLNLYQNDKIPPGSFIRAILENDLGQALSRADKDSLKNLKEIHSFVYNNLPGNIWGSRAAVKTYLSS